MTRDELQIVHEIGQLDRRLVISVKAIIEQRDAALYDAETWKQRALRAEEAEHRIRTMLAATKT